MQYTFVLQHDAPLSRVNNEIKLVNSSSATITSIDTDTTLAADSATSLPTQHAVKYYVDAHSFPATWVSPVYYANGYVGLENGQGQGINEIDADSSMTANSIVKIPTQNAVKTYVDTAVGSGVFSWGTLTVPSGSGPFHNLTLSTSYSYFKVQNNSNAGSIITGFANGVDGRRVTIIYNLYPATSGNTLNINNDDSGSIAANRVLSPTGGGINLNPNSTAVLSMMYDGAISRWIVTVIQP
jgi:hypothetical protein